MKSRSLWLVGVLFVLPAWSQEPAFDLSNDSIKKIVRDVAATQSATVQLSEETPLERAPFSTIDYMTPVEERAPLKSPAPPRPTTAPKSDGLFSTLVDILLDTALDDLSSEQCSDDDKTVTQAVVTLPQRP